MPNILGEDPIELAEYGFGAAAAGFVNDRFVSGFVKGFAPGSNSNNTIGQLVDAGATMASAWVAGKVVSFINKSAGRRFFKGGMILAVAKGVAAFVPGYSLSAEFPSTFLSFGKAPAAPAALNPAIAGGVGSPSASVGAGINSARSVGQSGL